MTDLDLTMPQKSVLTDISWRNYLAIHDQLWREQIKTLLEGDTHE